MFFTLSSRTCRKGKVTEMEMDAEDMERQTRGKPRTVLLLDPELDDQNTLIRYLLYSDQFETEALIYQSSIFHWKGDGKGTLFQGESEHTRFGIGPIASWRWDEDTRFMEDAVEIYAKVYPNLKAHSDDFPQPDVLMSRILEGNVQFPGDISQDSPGSERIKALLLDDKAGPLYLLSGAGLSTIGRALKSIEEEFKQTEQWENVYHRVSKKAIIQAFGDQDGVYPNYIAANWPDIDFREMSTMLWGYMAHKEALPHDRQYLSAAWMRENVSSVGPFGAFYRVWGDGKIMHKNDITDFFGFAGLTAEQLTKLGYFVWLAHFGQELGEPGSWISEGDTSIFMNLIDNGLDAHVNSSYGGWGGRNGKDIAPDGTVSRSYAAARWFGAAQRDFAARMKWSVTPRYADANHAPAMKLISPGQSTVRPGQTVTLTARVKDPDGDHVVGRWWRYEEADTYPGAVELTPLTVETKDDRSFVYPFAVPEPGSPDVDALIESEKEVSCRFTVPHDAADGQTLHLICEASDNGTPSLTAYRRVVLTVVRA